MIIGVLREARARGDPGRGHTRHRGAAAQARSTPSSSSPGAGAASGFSDEAYAEAGATIGAATGADIVFGVNAPSAEQLDGLREGTTLVCLLSAGAEPRPARGPGAAAHHGAGDGRGAAHLARAVARRAVARWPTSRATAR